MDALAYLLFGVFTLTVEHALPTVAGVTPDLALPIVIGLALRRPTPLGALCAFLLGYLGDLFSGVPPGLGAFVAVAAFLVVRALRDRLSERRPLLLGLLACGASLGAGLIVVVLHHLFTAFPADVRWSFAGIPVRAALTGLLTPFVLWPARRLGDALRRRARGMEGAGAVERGVLGGGARGRGGDGR